MYDEDAASLGYVMNVTRLWGHLPAEHEMLFELIEATAEAAGLSHRDRGILITAVASTLGDSSCSLAWGGKLAAEADADLVVGVLSGRDEVSPPHSSPSRTGRGEPLKTPTPPRPRTSTSSARRATTTGRSPRSRSSSGCGSRSPP